MNTVAEAREGPQAQLQAKIDEPVHTQLKILAARKKCHPRDLVNEALKDYLPKVERALDKPKRGE